MEDSASSRPSIESKVLQKLTTSTSNAPSITFTPVRITSQSKLNNIISFSLSHFYELNPSPVLFHSLHLPSLSPSSSTSIPIQTSTPSLTAPPPPQPDPTPVSKEDETKAKRRVIASSAIPKLISITEIIKRSYIPPPKAPPPPSEDEVKAEGKGKGKGKSKGKLVGLYQYNYLGTYEELGLTSAEGAGEGEEAEEMRREKVAKDWLQGGAGKKKRPRMTHTPLLLIILSTVPIPTNSLPKEFTYQAPLPLKKLQKKVSRTAQLTNATSAASIPNPALANDQAASAHGTIKHKKKRRKKTSSSKSSGGEGEGDAMEVDGVEKVGASAGASAGASEGVIDGA